jgi:esterase/lipase superfamily enzyme
MGFAEAAVRTAQMAHDLNSLAWPFTAGLGQPCPILLARQEIARLSESVFEQLIDSLTPATDIYIVAHSMAASSAARAQVDGNNRLRT